MMSPSFLAVSAATEAVAVANIDSPTELNAQAGTTVGERKVAYQVIANDNVYTVYYFDSADGAGATSPYVMAASGSGYWIAAGGKYTNSATVLRSTLDVGGAITGSSTVQGTRLISTIATGTAPLTVTSTTVVGNLNVSQLLGSTWASPAAIGSGTPAAGTFSSLVSNADVAASGKFLPNNSVSAYLNGSQGAVYGSTTGGGAFPFLSAGNLVLEARGGANARSVVLAAAGGAFTAYLDTAGAWNIPVATGTAPLVIASTTVVGNLNVSQLLGGTWAVPGTIGSTTANTGAFTTLSASTSLSVTGGFATMDTAGGTSRGLKWGATAAQMVLYDDGAGTAYIDYQGSATNIPLNIRTKGTGVIRLLPGSGAIIGGTAGGGLVGSELLRVVGAGYFDGGLTVVGAMSVGAFAATSLTVTATASAGLTYTTSNALAYTKLVSTASHATTNQLGLDLYLNNASGVAKEYGYFVWQPNVGTAGSEQSKVQLGVLDGGAAFTALSFTGRDATFIRDVNVGGALSVTGTSALAAITGTTLSTTGAINASTAAVSSTPLSINGPSGGFLTRFIVAGGATTNWAIGATFNISNGLEITRSTAAGGTTFSVPSVAFFNDGRIKLNGTASASSLLHLKQLADDATGGLRFERTATTDTHSLFMQSGLGSLSDVLTLYSSFAGAAVHGFDRNGIGYHSTKLLIGSTTDDATNALQVTCGTASAGISLKNTAGASQLTIDDASAGGGADRRIYFTNSVAGSKTNWRLGCQVTTNNALEIGHSTTAGGTTYTTDFLIDSTGNAFHKTTDAGTTSRPNTLLIGHNTSGTPASGFGTTTRFQAQTTTTADQDIATFEALWVSPTHASRTSRVALSAFDSVGARECLRMEATGSAAAIGFLGASAVAQRGSTSDLRQTIIDYGLLASGGATPLDLNGGALTAGHTNLGGGTNLTGASVGVTGFTGISAATTVMGFQVSATTPVTAGNTIIGAQIGLTTPASTPILTSLGVYCPATVLGGGATMGRAVGVMVDPQSIGTNNCGVLISATYPPTYTGNYALRSESTAQSTYAGGISSSHATAGIGYAVGAGGAVTQATSKATGVTLNTVCGTITLNGAALASVTSVAFTLTNSAIAANDLVVCHHDSVGTLGGYGIVVTPATGSATVTVRNMTAGSLSEAIVLRFVVIKAVNS